MIGIIDYGAGNLFSVKNALDFLKIPSIVSKSQEEISKCDRIIIPGVGSFTSAMDMLGNIDLIGFIKQQAEEKPILGICLGMQILFTTGYENGMYNGLNLIDGEVVPIDAPFLKIPHMGWNKLIFNSKNPLTKNLPAETYAYFVHSFRAKTQDNNIVAYSFYGEKIPAIINSGNVYGCQFHPEKSGKNGLQILKNFNDI